MSAQLRMLQTLVGQLKQRAGGGQDEAERLVQLYWLSYFWLKAIFRQDYRAPEEFLDAVKFTAHGNQLIEQCCSAYRIPQADAALALFGHFYWSEIFVDAQATDLCTTRKLLQADLLNDRIRIPYSWGRELHDRLHESYRQHELKDLNSLPHSDGWKLLDGMLPGVFQHGTFVSGPLGIVESVEHRWLPLYPVIRCYYREGTKTLQRHISFETADIALVVAYVRLEMLLSQGPPLYNWTEPLAWFGSQQLSQKHSHYHDIALLIADCILDESRTRLLEEVLKSDVGKRMRQIVEASPVSTRTPLPPRELAESLDTQAQLQLLLCAPTEHLVECIDELVLSREIAIPAGEVRFSRRSPPSRNICVNSELSSLGIRPAHPNPFAVLCSLIQEAYAAADNPENLQWNLGSDAERGSPITLTDFIRQMGPENAVSRLILISQPVTKFVCQSIGINISEVHPRSVHTIPRILWKLGFEIPKHDDQLELLRRRLESFENCLDLSRFTHDESDREKLRREGVNLFVSVEAFLDRLVSFNTWMLSSDHWGETQFNFHLSHARQKVKQVLGESIDLPTGKVYWKENGENTLGAQVAYLEKFRQWLESLHHKSHLRRSSELQAARDEFGRPFPFQHKQLWADADPVQLARYREIVRQIVNTLSEAGVAQLRNGLDHHRDLGRFPKPDQIDRCISLLKQVVKHSEQFRFYPVVYWFESQTERVYGTTEYVFSSARNGTCSIHTPSTVSSLPEPSRVRPIIFAPVNFLGTADSLLHFQVMGESTYSRYWSNFPKVLRVETESDCAEANLVVETSTVDSRECDNASSVPSQERRTHSDPHDPDSL